MQAAQGPHRTEDPLQLPDCNWRRVSPSIICGFPLDLEVWRFRTKWSLGSHLQAKKLQSFTSDLVFSHGPVVVLYRCGCYFYCCCHTVLLLWIFRIICCLTVYPAAAKVRSDGWSLFFNERTFRNVWRGNWTKLLCLEVTSQIEVSCSPLPRYK